jgi:predicted N-acyltransferase
VADFLVHERHAVARQQEMLDAYTPFRKS